MTTLTGARAATTNAVTRARTHHHAHAGRSRAWSSTTVAQAAACCDGPEEIALRSRRRSGRGSPRAVNRAVELRVERAATKLPAPSALSTPASPRTGCRRSLETRWETSYANSPKPRPTSPRNPRRRRSLARGDRAARARPARAVGRESTCEKDRKRLLRAVIADVTITSEPEGASCVLGSAGARAQRGAHRHATEDRQEVIRTAPKRSS